MFAQGTDQNHDAANYPHSIRLKSPGKRIGAQRFVTRVTFGGRDARIPGAPAAGSGPSHGVMTAARKQSCFASGACLTGIGPRFAGMPFRSTEGAAHHERRGYVKFREVAS